MTSEASPLSSRLPSNQLVTHGKRFHNPSSVYVGPFLEFEGIENLIDHFLYLY